MNGHYLTRPEVSEQATATKLASEPSEKYRGVGGWLALFCFAVLVGRPWRTVIEAMQFEIDIKLARGWRSAYSAAELHRLLIVGRIQIVLLALLTLYGLFVGVRLLQQKPSALKHVKRLLAAGMVYVVGSAVTNLSLWGIVDWKSGVGIGVLLSWWAYFARSKRVRATYGRNL